MKEDLNYVIDVSKDTIKKLQEGKIGTDRAKAIAYNANNVVKACIAKLKLK